MAGVGGAVPVVAHIAGDIETGRAVRDETGPRSSHYLLACMTLLYTANFVFLFRSHVPNELIPINPLGMTVTYFREDQAFK